MKKNERKNLKKLYKSNKFCDILSITKGITAAIGSGGKTSLLYRLCSELAGSGRVVFTTSTHIMRPVDMPVAENLGELDRLLGTGSDVNTSSAQGRPVCIGSAMPDNPNKLAAPNVSMNVLSERADYVLVEADGSKMLPIKAHKSYEPVIPDKSGTVVLVVGLSGIGKRVADTVHRIEEFAAMTGAKEDDIVTPEMVAKGIVAELPNYRSFNVKVYLNQTDIEAGEAKAEALAKALRMITDNESSETASCDIYAGSLKEGYIYEL